MSEGRSCERNDVPLNFMGHFPEENQLFEAIWTSKFQSSAAIYMRSAPFCDFTQRRLVVSYRRFGTDRLSRMSMINYHFNGA